jgi:AcrR family transcriptional regulator
MLRALGGRESGGAVAAPKTAAELLGVPPPPKTGRDRLVDTAINLFYAHGYNAVGLDRILAEVGVTKTTFYKHFASKDDLMVEAVRRRHVWEQQAWERAVRKIAGDDPRGQLLALFDVMHTWFNDPDFKGCLFINTAAEFPNPHDPIHKAAAAHKRAARNGARDKALAAGAAPEKAERFADLFTLLVEGTLVMRQIHGRDDAAVIARGVAERLLDEYVPRQPPAATEAE